MTLRVYKTCQLAGSSGTFHWTLDGVILLKITNNWTVELHNVNITCPNEVVNLPVSYITCKIVLDS